ncbi:hypothetical protein SDC9_50637 [bioreactor metagenome]|uniref:Uncharacterized protein n=1 Tax=bioreactor metagenome TaxID=1076179 RepID=A0A644WKQ7_9ZZZZ
MLIIIEFCVNSPNTGKLSVQRYDKLSEGQSAVIQKIDKNHEFKISEQYDRGFFLSIVARFIRYRRYTWNLFC